MRWMKLLNFLRFFSRYPKFLYYTLRGYRKVDILDQRFYIHKSAYDHMGIHTDDLFAGESFLLMKTCKLNWWAQEKKETKNNENL